MDQAFAGAACHFIFPNGTVRLLDVQQWRGEPDNDDIRLFVDPCRGATLDIGCGPGRLAAALSAKGIPAMGIDMSIEAIRQARNRGAVAIRRDVFSTIPGEGRWDFALLADGNLGIGGDPVRLLRRAADLVRPGGEIIAEVDPEGTGIIREHVRLRVGARVTAPFAWASVGIDGIDAVATAAGLVVVATQSVGQRHTASLRRAIW
ncbi:MAG: class I SAM-dependent methyltransferase [Kineosporiaceae bacterium]|nr:class I SAM-dependent methyltransferase [Aeromicrobium sp.]